LRSLNIWFGVKFLGADCVALKY